MISKWLGIVLLLIVLAMVWTVEAVRKVEYALVLLALAVAYIMGGIVYSKKVGLDENTTCLVGSQKKNSGLLFGGCLDVWHVQHVLLWMIVGLIMPGRFLVVGGVSLMWEAIEHFAFKNVLGSCSDPLCGRVEDIVLNMVGYAVGTLLAKRP